MLLGFQDNFFFEITVDTLNIDVDQYTLTFEVAIITLTALLIAKSSNVDFHIMKIVPCVPITDSFFWEAQPLNKNILKFSV
jgi:hypothetical protein